jgi:hypothetical protein
VEHEVALLLGQVRGLLREFGHVESLCGKSFAHISRRMLQRSFTWKATQSSWNVA